MKFAHLFIFLCLATSSLLAQGGPPPKGKIHKLPESEASKTISLNPEYWVYGEEHSKGNKLPLLIVLHGGGGTGLDINRIRGAAMGPVRTLGQARLQAIVVSPQAAKNPMKEGAKGGWVPSDLDVLLPHLLKSLPIDPDRVYLTGSSMGGYGTYAWAGNSPQHFAAIAPMVGGIGPGGPKDITPDLDEWGKNLATLPMKTYYGEKDPVVPADRGAMIMEAIKKAGGSKAELIVLEGEGHNATRIPWSDPELFKWLFSHTRGK